jgi:hypothetical protein
MDRSPPPREEVKVRSRSSRSNRRSSLYTATKSSNSDLKGQPKMSTRKRNKKIGEELSKYGIPDVLHAKINVFNAPNKANTEFYAKFDSYKMFKELEQQNGFKPTIAHLKRAVKINSMQTFKDLLKNYKFRQSSLENLFKNLSNYKFVMTMIRLDKIPYNFHNDHAANVVISNGALRELKYLIKKGYVLKKDDIKTSTGAPSSSVIKYIIEELGVDNVEYYIWLTAIRDGVLPTIKYLHNVLNIVIEPDGSSGSELSAVAEYNRSMAIFKYLYENIDKSEVDNDDILLAVTTWKRPQMVKYMLDHTNAKPDATDVLEAILEDIVDDCGEKEMLEILKIFLHDGRLKFEPITHLREQPYVIQTENKQLFAKVNNIINKHKRGKRGKRRKNRKK